MKTFSIVSAAIAIFSVFAAASPVAAPIAAPAALAPRSNSYGDDIATSLQSCSTKLDTCHAKWKETCKTTCSTSNIISWQKECAEIVLGAVTEMKVIVSAAVAVGAEVEIDLSLIVEIVATILAVINATLTFLLGQCGLLLGLLNAIILLVVTLLSDLKIAIFALIEVLVSMSASIKVDISVKLTVLLGSAVCYCCSLFGF